MGCLRNIINLIIICLAIIGFLSIGGKEFLETKLMPTFNKVKNEITTELDKSDKAITDMTLNEIKDLLLKSLKASFTTQKNKDGYEITEIKGLMGYDTKIAEDKTSEQKMVIVETKDKILIDLDKTDKAEIKADLLKLAKKQKASPFKFDDIDIVETGKWKTLDKELKYVKINITDQNTNTVISAIISSYPDDKDAKVLITFAPKQKFSKKIAEKYFKKMN